MKQSFKFSGQELESIRKQGRTLLGTLDARIEVSVKGPEAPPPRDQYQRRLDHAIRFPDGVPSVSRQYRDIKRKWNESIDGLCNQVSAIEAEAEQLLKAVPFIRGDAYAVLPDDMDLTLASACRTLRAGVQRGLSVAHVVESISSTCKSLDQELAQTSALLSRVRSAGDLAVSKAMSETYERSSRSFGHETKRGSSYLDLAVSSAADFKRGSAEYAALHFSAQDNATKRLAKAVRAGSVKISEILK